MLFLCVNNQVRMAIIAITLVIPLSSYAVLATDSSKASETSNLQLTVITSFYPLFEFSKQIAQDKADVSLLVPIGIEPHDWEPTIQDVQRMQKADLIVINGIGFEEWVHDLEETNYQGKIVDTSKGIVTKHNEIIEIDEDYHGLNDPHIWLNPVLVKIQVQNIADSFSKADPTNEKLYQNNAALYIKELDKLDSKIRNELSDCRTDFIAFHDAFSYFAEEYGLTQHTIMTNTPHGEPTAKTLENVIRTAKEMNVKIIFTEETVDSRTSEVIAAEIDGKILPLSPIEVGNENSYIQRMTQNLENLKEALC